MALTTLDPNTALIVIDLQKGLTDLPTVHPMGEVVARARTLAEAFRARSLPVVLVNVEATPPGRTERASRVGARADGWTDFVPELAPQPKDLTVTKRTAGAFTGTDLEARLRERGVTGIVLAGVATSMGVESTARHARDLGFNVALAIDAMTDLDPDAHLNSVARVFPRVGETGTTQEIVDLLGGVHA